MATVHETRQQVIRFATLAWTRCSREETLAVLDAIAAMPDPLPFAREGTEVTWREAPFYPQHRRYRLINYQTMPVFVREYVGDGVHFAALDGSIDDVYAINGSACPSLSEATLLTYLEFVLSSVAGPAGDAYFVASSAELELLSTVIPKLDLELPSPQFRMSAGGAFDVDAVIAYGRSVFTAALEIGRTGAVSIKSQRRIASDVDWSTDATRWRPDETSASRRDLGELFEPDVPLPPAATMLARAFEQLACSSHGQRLADLMREKHIDVGFMPARYALTYLPETSRPYVGVHGKAPPDPAQLTIILAGLLREVEQELAGLTHPPLHASKPEHVKRSMAKYEDKLWYMCTVALELDRELLLARSGFLEAVRRLGHAETVDLYLKQECP